MKDNRNFPFLANQTGVNSQAYDITANIPIKHTPKWQKNINKYKKCM
jgi:hypothetical protein